MKAVRSALAYFLLVFGAGFLLGPVRVLWLEPRVGARVAELIEAPLMLAVIVGAARWVVRRYLIGQAQWLRATAGAVALVMMVAAELALVLPVRGLALQEHFAARDPVSGTVYYAMLLVFAAMPLLVYRK